MLKQLYTYFGCKKKIVERVWQAWGDVKTTVEPFAGTAIVSLSQPETHCVTNMYINDSDCLIANVLRSVIYDPETVVEHAAHPRIELDLHMIHDYLLSSRPSLRELLGSHIDACNPVLAGLWIWGCNNWLGNGWCADTIILKKPDKVAIENLDLDEFVREDCILGKRVKPTCRNYLTERLTVSRRIKPTNCNKLTERLTGSGRNKPTHRNQLTERLTDNDRTAFIRELIGNIYAVLRGARVLYGDFERVLTETYTEGPCTGIFLDPPYPDTYDGQYLYSSEDSTTFGRSLKYFLDNNSNTKLRMVFCCQEKNLVGVELPKTVTKEIWSRGSGYSKQNKIDRHTEVMLFSKGCI